MSMHKRASMREGPLAALFRRTDRSPETEPQAAQPAPPSAEADSSAAADAWGLSANGSFVSHGLSAAQTRDHAAVEQAASAVPTPEDRLRLAFGHDIPGDILDSAPARRERSTNAAPPPGTVHKPVLRVVGVGGAGVNAVNRMVDGGIQGIEFIAINTDVQSLQQSSADITVHIGEGITRGLGSGSNPEVGAAAAKHEYDKLKALLKGSDMIFIAAGEGGGTGTGAAPIVARIAREVGALTVAIATTPFGFEGTRRREQAEAGIVELGKQADTLIVVPNNRLLSVLESGTSMVDAFRVADDVLRQGVQGISDLITLPGLINLDFADVRTIMSRAGQALLGIGMGVGERRAIDAAERAVESPLLETSVEGAKAILLSITGGRDMSLWEVNEAAKTVSAAAHPEANIIFGAMVDESIEDQVWVTVVATGYGDAARRPKTSAGRGRTAEPRVAIPAHERREVARLEMDPGLDVPEFVPRG